MAIQPDETRQSTRERVLRLASDVMPFDPERDIDRYRSGMFKTDEEMEQFLAEIYLERRKNPV